MNNIITKIKIYGPRKTLFFGVSEIKYLLRQIFQKSYSQRNEDLVIDKLLKYKKHGFYVDIGANDPHRFSNTKRFYSKGWRGINVDPNTEAYLKFLDARKKDINLNVGISNEKSKFKFYRFFPDTLSTFSSKLAKEYLKEGYQKVSEENIQTYPLSYIFNKYINGKKIDFMSIDTEGYDEIVLKSNNWKKYRPKIICVESNKAQENSVDKFLKQNKYVNVFDNGLNSIYKNTLP